MIRPSLSQEYEDTILCKDTWTCSSTSRITSTRTSPTDSMWTTSSESPRLPKLLSTRNTTTVSSMTQPTSTQRPTTQPPGPTLRPPNHLG